MSAPRCGRSRGPNLGSCRRLCFAQRIPEACGGARMAFSACTAMVEYPDSLSAMLLAYCGSDRSVEPQDREV
eukprot:9619546-Alexandrium_andersonii.AAC.1